MTTNVLLQLPRPLYRDAKVLIQHPDGHGGWTTYVSEQITGVPLVLQVHSGQRLIIEEVDLEDRRASPQKLQPRPSLGTKEGE